MNDLMMEFKFKEKVSEKERKEAFLSCSYLSAWNLKKYYRLSFSSSFLPINVIGTINKQGKNRFSDFPTQRSIL